MDNIQQQTKDLVANVQQPEQNIKGKIEQLTQDSKKTSLLETKNYFWYKDRATLIALISGFFSTLVTMLNVLLR